MKTADKPPSASSRRTTTGTKPSRGAGSQHLTISRRSDIVLNNGIFARSVQKFSLKPFSKGLPPEALCSKRAKMQGNAQCPLLPPRSVQKFSLKPFSKGLPPEALAAKPQTRREAPQLAAKPKKGGCIAIVKKPLVIQPHFALTQRS